MRPEYLEALEAARWNWWWLATLVLPALLICASSRKWWWAIIGFLVAVPLCWILFALAVEHFWEVKFRLAETEVERRDATADTARLFGPILIGTPFAVLYCTGWVIVSHIGAWIWHRLRRSRLPIALDGAPAIGQ